MRLSFIMAMALLAAWAALQAAKRTKVASGIHAGFLSLGQLAVFTGLAGNVAAVSLAIAAFPPEGALISPMSHAILHGLFSVTALVLGLALGCSAWCQGERHAGMTCILASAIVWPVGIGAVLIMSVLFGFGLSF